MKANKYQFADIPGKYTSYDQAKIVVVPVPFDLTATWRKGAAKGPEAILHASANLELYDISTDSEVYRQGIHTLEPILSKFPDDLVNQVSEKVCKLLTDGKFPVIIGGEHSVSIGSAWACAKYINNLSVLHLDAHADFRDEYEGSRFNHACVMTRITEEIGNYVSVGIRSMDVSEKEKVCQGNTFFAHDIASRPDDFWQLSVSDKLLEDVYVTIDIDVFDPAYVPSTGTPEPGGLDWYQVTNLLRIVAENHQVIGFDVVELCPEDNPSSDFLAAKLIYRFLSEIFS